MLLNHLRRQVTFLRAPDEGAGAGAPPAESTPPAEGGTPPAGDPPKGESKIAAFLKETKARFTQSQQLNAPDPAQSMASGNTPPAPSRLESTKAKLEAGETPSVQDFLALIEDQNQELEDLRNGVQNAQQSVAASSTQQVVQNAEIAANVLSREFGEQITHQDVLIAIQPLSQYIENVYGPSAGSTQSLIEAFKMVTAKHLQQAPGNGVNSSNKGSVPPLGVGNAGSAPAAKSLSDKINEAFRIGLKE